VLSTVHWLTTGQEEWRGRGKGGGKGGASKGPKKGRELHLVHEADGFRGEVVGVGGGEGGGGAGGRLERAATRGRGRGGERRLYLVHKADGLSGEVVGVVHGAAGDARVHLQLAVPSTTRKGALALQHRVHQHAQRPPAKSASHRSDH